MSRTLLGVGELDWFTFEEQTHRWGSVKVCQPYRERLTNQIGKVGWLEVIIRAAGSHQGRANSSPILGARHILGHGSLFVEEHGGEAGIGLIPADRRPKYWLSEDTLRRTSGCIVELWFDSGYGGRG